jgi:Protein SET DOMAIN GROUP 2 C-terminal
MLEACEANEVSEQDLIDLAKAGLGICLLSGLPDWLVAYTARLVHVFFKYLSCPSISIPIFWDAELWGMVF